MSKELMKQNIEKAQREIDSKKDIVKKGKMRQRYHFMAQTGWLNDPNGLIYFRGNTISFFSIIRIMDFGTVCIGDTRSAMICYTGNTFLWHWRPVRPMIIT